MAARLCIASIFQNQYARYMPQVTEWAKRRDALEREGMPEAARATQECVDYYCAKLYERGYFGDNYCHNLLKQVGLCWTRDIYQGLLGEQDTMSPDDARRLLQFLHEREPLFERNVRKARRIDGLSRALTIQYYRDKLARLQPLLKESITRREPIDFSR